MTNPTPPGQVPDALPAIQRFEVVDCIDSKHVPAVIPKPHGPWVRYEDHAAALCRLHAENEALRTQQDDAYDHGPQAETVEEAARDVGKWLNERPNRPLDLRHVAMLTHHAKRTAHVQNPAEIEHVAGDVSKNGAELNTSTQQPAPAGATDTKTLELLSTTVGLLMGYREGGARQPYKPGSVVAKVVDEVVDHLKDWPTPQPTPAAGVTVEQVEDAIGLQSTAWDTIGAEKIVEAVLRLTNGQAPATQQAGEVEGWLTWFRTPSGGREPNYSHGAKKPTHGAELDAILTKYPVYAEPRPSPTAQAASSTVLKAIRKANMQLVRTGDDAFMLVPYKVATAQAAESVPAGPKRKDMLWSTAKMQERHDQRIENIVSGLERIKQEHAGQKPQKIDECYGDCPTDPTTCTNPCRFDGLAARAPAESVVRDAERYRWLRHGDNDEKVLCNGPVAKDYWYLPRNEKLDAAIDSAKAANGDPTP